MTTTGVPVTRTPEERRARLDALRAANPGPLASHAYDPAPLAIGSVVSQRVDPLASHQPITGRVVERWATDTGELGVVLVEFWRKTVRTHRLLVADLVTDPLYVRPPHRGASASAARDIFASLGAGSGELSDYEQRQLHWADALLHAVGSTTTSVTTEGDTP